MEEKHSGPIDYKCEYCGREFNELRKLNGHIKIVHLKPR